MFETKTELADIENPVDFALDRYTVAVLNTAQNGKIGQLTKKPFKLK